MGYRGKLVERDAARELRADGITMNDIAVQLGVSRSSVSLWTRDVEFDPHPRRRARRRTKPNALQLRKQTEIDWARHSGVARVGELSAQAFLVAGAALYAGEGSRTDGDIRFANTDPAMVRLFCAWLRRFFSIDEARLRLTIYLHEGLDYDAACRHWSRVTGIPLSQIRKPYRAVAD